MRRAGWCLHHVVVILKRKMNITELNSALAREGITCTELALESFLQQERKKLCVSPEESIEGLETCLIITDSGEIARSFAEKQIGVVALLHRESEQEDFWGLAYAIDGLNDIDVRYLDRVYRRLKGIPWDILETKRCRLREITAADVPRIAELYEYPSVKKYMEPLYTPLTREIAYTEDYIKHVYGYYEYGTWVIIEKSTGTIIGRAGLENYANSQKDTGQESNQKKENPENSLSEKDGQECGEKQVELGYLIGDAYQRCGFAYEVCSAILQYAKEQLGIPVVWTRIDRENKASIKLSEKLGFQGVKQTKDTNMLLLRYEMKEKI